MHRQSVSPGALHVTNRIHLLSARQRQAMRAQTRKRKFC
jgi:hypothetical protein